MREVKEGSIWSGGDKKFRVLHVIEKEGNTWVHYRDEKIIEDDPREYSCYLESFIHRFTPTPD